MTISNELLLAILSTDSYNRGYSSGIGSQSDGLGSNSNGTARTGDAIVIHNLEDAGLQVASEAVGFYAIAYEVDGQTVDIVSRDR